MYDIHDIQQFYYTVRRHIMIDEKQRLKHMKAQTDLQTHDYYGWERERDWSACCWWWCCDQRYVRSVFIVAEWMECEPGNISQLTRVYVTQLYSSLSLRLKFVFNFLSLLDAIPFFFYLFISSWIPFRYILSNYLITLKNNIG